MRALSITLLLLVGCTVDLPETIRCTGGGPCPSGFTCNQNDLCVRDGEDAGVTPDANVPDTNVPDTDLGSPDMDLGSLDADLGSLDADLDAGDADAGRPELGANCPEVMPFDIRCNPVAQTGCEDGQNCYLVEQDSGRKIIQCMEPVVMLEVGAMCSAPNECERGLSCVAGRCTPLCCGADNDNDDSDCPVDQFCIDPVDVFGVEQNSPNLVAACAEAASCNPADPMMGCEMGEECFLRDRRVPRCEIPPEDRTAVGGSCELDSECQAGSVCLPTPDGTTRQCTRLCNSTSDCNTEDLEVCAPSGIVLVMGSSSMPIGICQPGPGANCPVPADAMSDGVTFDCNPVLQDCPRDEENCYLLNSGTTCQSSESTPPLEVGEACSGVATCKRGLSCVAGTCLPVCCGSDASNNDSDCPSGSLCASTIGIRDIGGPTEPNNVGFCIEPAECNVVNNTGCTNGTACFLVDGRFATCENRPSSTATLGGNCSTTVGCGPGLVCLADNTCHKLCDPTLSSEECGSGMRCRAIVGVTLVGFCDG